MPLPVEWNAVLFLCPPTSFKRKAATPKKDTLRRDCLLVTFYINKKKKSPCGRLQDEKV